MKYKATFNLYLEGPEGYDLEVNETQLEKEQDTIYSIVVKFLTLLSSISNIDEGFTPLTAHITADKQNETVES